MTVDLAVPPDWLRYSEAMLGVLLIGLAMAMTRLFVRVVTKEAEIGAHLPMKESGTLLRESMLVMLFPSTTALLILLGAWTTTRWLILLDIILYFGVVAVFVIGFSSSYVLDRDCTAECLLFLRERLISRALRQPEWRVAHGQFMVGVGGKAGVR